MEDASPTVIRCPTNSSRTSAKSKDDEEEEITIPESMSSLSYHTVQSGCGNPCRSSCDPFPGITNPIFNAMDSIGFFITGKERRCTKCEKIILSNELYKRRQIDSEIFYFHENCKANPEDQSTEDFPLVEAVESTLETIGEGYYRCTNLCASDNNKKGKRTCAYCNQAILYIERGRRLQIGEHKLYLHRECDILRRKRKEERRKKQQLEIQEWMKQEREASDFSPFLKRDIYIKNNDVMSVITMPATLRKPRSGLVRSASHGSKKKSKKATDVPGLATVGSHKKQKSKQNKQASQNSEASDEKAAGTKKKSEKGGTFKVGFRFGNRNK